MTPRAYELAQFRDPEAEMARLKRQAKVVQDAEHRAFDELGFPRTGRALDVGCGPGAFAAALGASRPGLSLVGVDIEREALSHCTATLTAVCADARRLPLPDDSFDAAFARLSLRYIPRPKTAVAEMARVVRPSGLVLVEDADHRALEVSPAIPGLQEVLSARHASIERTGADPHVIARAPALLQGARLRAVRSRELTVASAWIGVDAFAAIILKPIAEAVDDDLVDAARLQDLRAAIEAWSSLDRAHATTKVRFVAGNT